MTTCRPGVRKVRELQRRCLEAAEGHRVRGKLGQQTAGLWFSHINQEVTLTFDLKPFELCLVEIVLF